MGEESNARRLWFLLEPYHAVTYFGPESHEAFKKTGLRGFWMGYFAGRAAPLGIVGSGLVTATFYNFAPAMVARAIPDAWYFATVEEILRARLVGVDHTLTRLLGNNVSTPELAEAAALAQEAVKDTDVAGRPMFAANTDLDPPDSPHLHLWWAATCLREHRGDGHIAALVNAGLDGCEAHVSFSATGAVTRSVLQANRGWTDDEWFAATERLRSRGLLKDDDTLTDEGRVVRTQVEDDTDRLAEEPWRRLGPEKTERLVELLRPITAAVVSSGVIPAVNPMGLPATQ